MASSHSSHRPRATKKCTTVQVFNACMIVEQIITQIRSNVSCETVRYIPRIYPYFLVCCAAARFRIRIRTRYIMAIYSLVLLRIPAVLAALSVLAR